MKKLRCSPLPWVAEDDPTDTIRPRLQAAGADLDRVLLVTHILDDGSPRLPRIPDDLRAIHRLVAAQQACLVVFDPLVAYLGPKINAHKDQDVRRALASLAQVAALTGAAVVAVRHLAKLSSPNPLYRGGGSIGLIGAARSGLLVVPDPDDPLGARRLLVSTKSNLGPIPPSLAYHLLPAPGGVAAVEWLGCSARTAATLHQADQPRQAPRVLDDARAFLRALLAASPLPAAEVHRHAAEAGLSHASLRRVQAALDIRPKKLGGPGGGWLWALPPQPISLCPSDPSPINPHLEC